MHDIGIAFPALTVMRVAVAAVWLYEGLWNKLLSGAESQTKVVTAVPKLGPLLGPMFLKTLGVVEVAVAVWVLSGVYPGLCAIGEVTLLACLNINGLLWARHIIHDPGGMIVKNSAFLVLVWASGALPGVHA
jgi:uncharacterized membrane protein YphA (DoxX/SURF4 family)